MLDQVYSFGATTVCVELPESAEQAFGAAEQNGTVPVWDYEGGAIAGGHAVAGVGAIDDQLVVISWGRPVIVTAAFVQHYLEVNVCYVSGSALKNGVNVANGLDLDAVRNKLAGVR